MRWFQADVGDIPDYVAQVKLRLSGVQSAAQDKVAQTSSFPATSTNSGDCGACGNTGFVTCNECQGNGTVTRSLGPLTTSSLTLTCSACVGYRKLRCPVCGGRYLKC